ncbi:MAG TPA: pantoate--beta-alanine ligase [Ignavibacteriaceae bacterium]|nr:pantoate--beta-alanine ligase [Ignavibacteriaceae bacterium]
METLSTVSDLRKIIRSLKAANKSIGFVPTMGFLHEGHLSLVRESQRKCDVTIVSIFVNPTQFSPTEDLSKYPRDLNRDSSLLLRENVDYLFCPEIDEIYTPGFSSFIEVGPLAKILEGEFRPTHFRGVTTVVSILFNIVQPDYAFFGQKDAQQVAVLKKMVSDLKFDIQIIVCPIVREPDGLAMSSRNVYLSAAERKDALVLSEALKLAKNKVEIGARNSQRLIEEMKNLISSVATAQINYIKIVEAKTFIETENLNEGIEYLILIACKIGHTRLIDNLLLKL